MDTFQLLKDSGHVAPPNNATVQAAVDLVLTDAFREGDVAIDAISAAKERRHSSRRRAYIAGAAAMVAAAIGVAVPLSVGGGGAAAPVLKLASYSLRLPTQYHLTAATTSSCHAMLMYAPPTPNSDDATTPGYASADAAAATASGGCLTMVLAPTYTPTASQPDPEATISKEPSTQHVQVGPYDALVYTGSLYYSRTTGYGPVTTLLFVEIPLADGQTQDLVVGEQGLSQSQLLTLVANGLSVSPASSSPASLPAGNSGTPSSPAGNSGSSSS